MTIKEIEISNKIRNSIKENGNNPHLFGENIALVVATLQLLIRQVFEKASAVVSANPQTVEQEPEQQKKPPLVEKYPSLLELKRELNWKNYAINEKEQQLEKVKKELANTKGLFKGKLRKQLQEQIEKLEKELTSLKHQLPEIVQKYGYKTVQEFLKELKAAETANKAYQASLTQNKKKPEVQTPKVKPLGQRQSVLGKLRENQQNIKEREPQKTRTPITRKDKGAR